MNDSSRDTVMTTAHVGPLAIFMVFLLVPDLIQTTGLLPADAPWWFSSPAIWLYPVQTLACAAALFVWRRQYDFAPARGLVLAVAVGIAGIILWITPGFLYQHFRMEPGWWQHLGFAARTEGFNPAELKVQSSASYSFVLAIRFLRLVVIVPLVEEIFWRGFLMRFLVDPDGDFWEVPFGTHHIRSLVIVTALFVLAHAPVDYAAAMIYGVLTYWLAVTTKSLLACVVMHGVANLLLGIYIVTNQQWGYW